VLWSNERVRWMRATKRSKVALVKKSCKTRQARPWAQGATPHCRLAESASHSAAFESSVRTVDTLRVSVCCEAIGRYHSELPRFKLSLRVTGSWNALGEFRVSAGRMHQIPGHQHLQTHTPRPSYTRSSPSSSRTATARVTLCHQPHRNIGQPH
jgi:hypothetical protein